LALKLSYNTVYADICCVFQVYEEFCTSSQALSVEKLIETFVQAKSTGTEKPGEFNRLFDTLRVFVIHVIFYFIFRRSKILSSKSCDFWITKN